MVVTGTGGFCYGVGPRSCVTGCRYGQPVPVMAITPETLNPEARNPEARNPSITPIPKTARVYRKPSHPGGVTAQARGLAALEPCPALASK